MPAPKDLFKLQKLTITAYKSKARKDTEKVSTPFEVMYNPASFSMKHENFFQKKQGMGDTSGPATYVYSKPDELKLDLVIDGTGAADLGIATLLGRGSDSVADQIKNFNKLFMRMNEDEHEPNFLRIQWGEGPLKEFDCQLQSVEIKYTSFDRSGAAQRAELKTVFAERLDDDKRIRIINKKSADLSHKRVVKSGDTLPLLSQMIYGSSKYYLLIAQVNGLDDFRNLTPGQEISFPPLKA